MPRRKVLIIPAWYPTARNPMAGVFVREQARALTRVADVAVVHVEWAWPRPPRPVEVAETVEDGIRTVRIRILRLPSFGLLAPERIGYAVGLRRLRKNGFDPDVLHGHVFRTGFHAVQLGRRIDRPVVITEHSSLFARRRLRRWERVVAARAFRAAEIVMPVSDDLQRHIEAHGMSARFRVVPNVVDAAVFDVDPADATRAGPKRLLVVAALKPIKRIDLALGALAHLKSRNVDAALDVVGDGPEEKSLRRLAGELGIADRVTFHGYRDHADIAALMQRADLLVLSSAWENMPCALLEAQVAGLPAVAATVGGVPEVVDHANGRLFPPGDADKLADALIDALESPFDRSAISRRAQETFGMDAIAARIDAVYSEAEARFGERSRARKLRPSRR